MDTRRMNRRRVSAGCVCSVIAAVSPAILSIGSSPCLAAVESKPGDTGDAAALVVPVRWGRFVSKSPLDEDTRPPPGCCSTACDTIFPGRRPPLKEAPRGRYLITDMTEPGVRSAGQCRVRDCHGHRDRHLR